MKYKSLSASVVGMKNIAVFLFSVLFINVSSAQITDPKPGSALPSFKILKTNGGYFTNNDIKKNVPVVLIYFAPDCDHCIKLMDQLFKKIHELDKARILMVTFRAPNDVAWFERKYQTAQYPNITVGTEGTSYVLRNYYRLDKTPFTAVYDKKGRLAFSYKDETPVNEMLTRFKKI
jgi:thiol-disulfide isomerase/thioredoxin